MDEHPHIYFKVHIHTAEGVIFQAEGHCHKLDIDHEGIRITDLEPTTLWSQSDGHGDPPKPQERPT